MATITWTTSEPTTSMVEYGVDGLTNKVNDTILHVDHSVTLTGLDPAAAGYQVRVSSYDGNANGVSSSIQFCSGQEPVLSLSYEGARWASNDDYLARQLSVDYSIVNLGASTAVGVTIVGTEDTNGVFSTGLPVIGDLTPSTGASFTLTYTIPPGVQAYRSTVFATAGDSCGNLFNYPGPLPV
jgi:hypothetical protein